MTAPTALNPVEFAQQLKNAISIEQVVSEYVPSLKRAGTSLKGLCPFHQEKTPSFNVHLEFQFYHCFGCGAHGDVVKFVQEIEKVDFMMALELLARRAGVAIPKFRGGQGRSSEQDQHMQRLREVCQWAAGFFTEQLNHHPRGRTARAYLNRRGLDDEFIDAFRLGYAPPDFDALLKAAERAGWRAETLAEAGLASRSERGRIYDRFRDRVMFPIEDRHGAVVAFGGRVLEDKGEAAKYLNSAETPIFKKSRLLYGFSRARKAIRDAGEVILLEGYMDWIALYRHGFGHALASMGTSFTEDQGRLVKQITRKAILLYDGDVAGQQAMFRSAEVLLRQGLEVYAAVLPAEHDPDTFIKAQGTEAMRDILARSPKVIDYFIEHVAVTCGLDRPEGKAEAVSKVAPLLLALSDPVLREGYIQHAAMRFGLKTETLEAALRRRRHRERNAPVDHAGAGDADVNTARGVVTEQNLLYILLSMQDRREAVLNVRAEWFATPMYRTLFERIQELEANRSGDADDARLDPFALCRDDEECQWMTRILLLPSQMIGGELKRIGERLDKALDFQVYRLKRNWIQRRKQELSLDLQTILGQAPLGKGQLEQIERLSRENLDQHAWLLKRSHDSPH